jgi:selenophosphate synthetase-related protein
MEMDELKLTLSTKFMRGIVAKLISKTLIKKFGYDIDIQIKEIGIEVIGGKVHIHTDVDAEINKDEFVKILKSNGLN